MCMYIWRASKAFPKPKLAEENIPCFKCVIANKEGDMYSAIRRFPYEFEELYTEGGVFSDICIPGYHYCYIQGGGFHSFAKILDAFEYSKHYNITDEEKVIVVQCHIPKGSLYYIGEAITGEPSYVSQSIVIDEIINDN